MPIAPPSLSVEQFTGTPVPLTLTPTANYVWSTVLFRWVMETQGGGGGGGAVTIADGADVAEGATTDAAVITDTTGTVSGKLRGLVKWAFERMPASLGQKAMVSSLPVVIASDQSAIPVTQSTSPWIVSGAITFSSPQHVVVDSGTIIATQGTSPWVENLSQVGGSPLALGQTTMANSVPVTLASNQSTLAVSVTSLPLPSNAAQETGGNLAAIYALDTAQLVPLLQSILAEMRVTNYYLQAGLNVRDETDTLRNDGFISTVQ